MNSNKKNLSKTTTGTLLFFALLAVLALFFLLSSGGNGYKSSLDNLEMIANNVQILKDQENREPVVRQKNFPGEIVDMQAEQDKVLAITAENFDNDALRGWFQNTVILGDSLTAAAAQYGYLGTDVVLGQIGVGLESGSGQFEQAKQRHPAVAFLCFGSNDMTNYMTNTSAFIQKYSECINNLKSAVPNVVCYVMAIFPMQPHAFAQEPGGVYQAQYNEALQQYCEQTENVNYIDSTFLLERMPELYEPDGIHPVSAFYPKWLTFFADVAGLSSES